MINIPDIMLTENEKQIQELSEQFLDLMRLQYNHKVVISMMHNQEDIDGSNTTFAISNIPNFYDNKTPDYLMQVLQDYSGLILNILAMLHARTASTMTLTDFVSHFSQALIAQALTEDQHRRATERE